MESWLDCYRRSDAHRVEQLADVFILQRHTAPCPIALRAVAVNVNVAAQMCVLRRSLFCPQRARDRVVLRARDQAIAQTSFSMRGVRIAQPERKIKRTLRILSEDVELAFRRAPIACAHFVPQWAQSQSDAISAHQPVTGKQQQLSLGLLNDDFGIAERQLQWRTVDGRLIETAALLISGAR